LSSPTYAIRSPLSCWLREEAARLRGRPRLLDVGCGLKPYYPFFADRVSEYVGVDAAHPAADLNGVVEDLPVPDASFDLVLCLQVLEHSQDPARAVHELRRVVAPGGRVLASTHGVYLYHPNPDDFWRWTHTGLARLFEENGDWSHVRVVPGGGTAAAVGMLVAVYANALARRAGLTLAGRALAAGVNSAAAALDRRFAPLREPRPGSLFANYHVTAVAP
jgi:SAM-dependent methyltransferase